MTAERGAAPLARALMRPTWHADGLLGGEMGMGITTMLTALVLWPLNIALLVVAYLPDPRLGAPHEFYPSDLARLRQRP